MTDTHTQAVPELHDFTALYDLYHEAILRYCECKCRDHEIAQDLKQATFLRFWLCLERKEEILNARAFLYRIAHNLIIDYVRKKKSVSLDQLLEDGFEPSTNPWPQTVRHMDSARPMLALKNMGRYSQVLHRRFIQGLTPTEIAGLTGETTNTVSVGIFRGLKHLRVMLKDESRVAA